MAKSTSQRWHETLLQHPGITPRLQPVSDTKYHNVQTISNKKKLQWKLLAQVVFSEKQAHFFQFPIKLQHCTSIWSYYRELCCFCSPGPLAIGSPRQPLDQSRNHFEALKSKYFPVKTCLKSTSRFLHDDQNGELQSGRTVRVFVTE